MTDCPAEAAGRPHWTHRLWRWVAIAAVVIALVVVLWNQGSRLINGQSIGGTSYLLVALLVFGDAVCPILPGETTLSAASVLAHEGKLNIWLVVVAGAIGATTGDSAVYWIARKAKGRVRGWMDRASDNDTGAKMIGMLNRHGPVFLLFGRYVPGVRFALNATLGGVVKMPYPRFVGWSALSGTIWSAFTCASAFYISTLLDGYPLLSLVVTVLVSTTLITVIIWVQRQVEAYRGRHQPVPAAEPARHRR